MQASVRKKEAEARFTRARQWQDAKISDDSCMATKAFGLSASGWMLDRRGIHVSNGCARSSDDAKRHSPAFNTKRPELSEPPPLAAAPVGDARQSVGRRRPAGSGSRQLLPPGPRLWGSNGLATPSSLFCGFSCRRHPTRPGCGRPSQRKQGRAPLPCTTTVVILTPALVVIPAHA